MTRDEVLKAVEIAAEEASAAAVGLKCTGQGRAFTWYSKQADLLRAAAELIRQSGWRPIAEAPEGGVALWVGSWEKMADGSEVFISWDEQQFKRDAIAIGYTHYLPKPEPPAREVPNG